MGRESVSFPLFAARATSHHLFVAARSSELGYGDGMGGCIDVVALKGRAMARANAAMVRRMIMALPSYLNILSDLLIRIYEK